MFENKITGNTPLVFLNMTDKCTHNIFLYCHNYVYALNLTHCYLMRIIPGQSEDMI